MFTNGSYSQIGYNGVNTEPKFHPIDNNKPSHTNQHNKTHQSPSAKASFIKRFNPFSKSKSQTINCVKHESLNDKEFTSVKVLKQFWNDQIKTAKSSEHLDRQSATIRYLSQSNDSINDLQPNRAQKSQTLDGRLPLDEFNKYKDANFVRNKKIRLKTCDTETVKLLRPESFTLNDNHFPQISATGGKIHWAKREDIFTKKVQETEGEMSVKSNKMKNAESCEIKAKKDALTKKESISSSIGSLNSSVSSNTNLASRKFSFKTTPSTTSAYMNKKIAATSNNGTKVAQIAQRFNQMIQQDASLFDEVKKRGTVVLHRSGGCVFKIKEEKVDNGKAKKSNDEASDDAASLPSIGKNSTRKKSSLKKRPSIRILVESPKKNGSNVLSKRQLYETNIVNKETIVIKPKVPDKSERVLAKTKEMKNKKLNDVKTEKVEVEVRADEKSCEVKHDNSIHKDPVQSPKKNNFQKIYDKISFRPTFLYGKKATKLETTHEKPSVVETAPMFDDADDSLEFQPIDLNLNVYFNNENLSKDVADENVNSQGPLDVDDVTDDATADECKAPSESVKPNSSFLFRAQSIGKIESAADVFIRDMLNESTSMDVESDAAECEPTKINLESVKCNSDHEKDENSYEIISKENIMRSECVDIDSHNGNSDEENIYQSLCEVKGDNESIKSYESFENYDEIAQNILDNKINLSDLLKGEDDYIFPEKAPEPPPPRKNTIPRISSPILTSTTSNLVQSDDLQVPKLKFNYELQKSNSCASTTTTTYEKIKYDQYHVNQQPKVDDENIYDTIKNGSLVMTNNKKVDESFADNDENPYKNSKNDTMSIISNCYESISLKQNYSTINQILRHAISTTTLNSEHRINSIYGTMVGQSLTPPSDRSASDNSDEWIDLSDEENEPENETDNRFIVICKKTKSHKSPDWSRLVRQKLDEWDDDSDHHYESLYSIQQQRAALEGKLENEKPLGQDFDKFRENAEEYDSFDDSDEENEESKTSVDISHVKLPDPPQNTGQVYAFVQRIKNFGSISKNEISKGISKIAKKRGSLGKIPSSRSQFYESTQIAEESPYVPPKYESKSLGKKSRGLAKLQKLGRLTINKLPTNFSLNEPFDHSQYQTPRIGTKESESNSSPNLSKSMSNFNSPESDVSKNDKSLKSKLRKASAPSMGSSSTSNIYGALSSKNSTFYVTDSHDVDSGIFAVNEKSTSSPDNSNLNLSSNSSSSVNCDLKRRSIASINGSTSSRPNDPPPPPPSETASTRSRRIGTTSWYAECGLFKNEDINDEENHHHMMITDEKGEKTSATSWYTESGLYQTSNNSVASSSGSSGVSTGGECSSSGSSDSHSMFLNEPLYQLYTAAKLESISSSEFEPENESDGYEEISKKDIQEVVDKKPSRPSALQLIEPNQGPSRTLWSEVPEVIQSGIFEKLSQNEKRLQEAKFEILTSEASYLKSLNLLRSHFMNHPAFRDPQNLDPADRKTLFSYIVPVLECSDRILCDLESSWQDNVMLKNLSKNIFKHAEKHFHVYISYCEHQGRLDRTLKRLKESNTIFKETLDILENDSVCCGLNLHSFLMLPMQRITRLPLLIDAVMTKLKSNDEEFDDWKMTLAILNKIVFQCNQAANRCEQAFEMEVLSKQIEFPANITPFPLIPFNVTPSNRLPRTLVRRGELVHIIYRGDDAKLTFGKKATIKKNIYCFLFTDIMILTKKKSDESYLVFDYCQRSLLQLSSGEVIPQLPPKDINTAGKYIIFMSLLENCIGKPIDLILACPSETERQRWLQATAPPTSENPYETLYEQWDCPQVVIKHAYQALEPDELTLDNGDVVNVLRKMKDDGWYYGERIRDGTQGWFPGNYAEEVHSSHVRARNLKQRHRLLLYTATYLESQKEPGTKKK